MHSDYKSSSIRELRDQQVRFAPREKKIEQLENAERLMREIDLEKTYSYEYVCFRVTGYRPESAPLITMSGQRLRHDLHCLIEDLSESADIRADEDPHATYFMTAGAAGCSLCVVNLYRHTGADGTGMFDGEVLTSARMPRGTDCGDPNLRWDT